MKDGRTHLAHKAEHAVDLETGAVVAVTVQDANAGDTATSVETLITAAEKIETVLPDGEGWKHPAPARHDAVHAAARLATMRRHQLSERDGGTRGAQTVALHGPNVGLDDPVAARVGGGWPGGRGRGIGVTMPHIDTEPERLCLCRSRPLERSGTARI
jgi:hypothetical protein